ncbi:erg26, C-3 sterol dehydrogenase [Naganishia albida]|nr:erg26, C-3 sterol dehydrogenase [Naganishia albida]
MANASPTYENYLVVGGCGFLGRHIVEQLLARGENSVSVFDLVQRHFDESVTFYTGDITFPDDIDNAIQKSKATVVIHTASPIHGQAATLYEAVNVRGTSNVIASCISNGVRKLVYTSSAGVVYNGSEDLVDVDERMDIPQAALDAYNKTKADAERLVINANGQPLEGEKEAVLQTCALRPAGIFGPYDRQQLAGFKSVIVNGQTKFQIGNNDNLFDWTYVGNVAHAHLLAADRLGASVSEEEFTYPLADICLSTGEGRVPTSRAKPLGPSTAAAESETFSEEDKRAAKAFEQVKDLRDEQEPDLRPVLRTKMDQFSSVVSGDDEDNAALGYRTIQQDCQVAGQVFFITNCEPMYFWDFARQVWKSMGHVAESKITLPASVGVVLATLAEAWSKLRGTEAGFTRFRVKFATQKRYYNAERARRLLGYEPIVGVEEGLKRTMEWYNAEEQRKAEAASRD